MFLAVSRGQNGGNVRIRCPVRISIVASFFIFVVLPLRTPNVAGQDKTEKATLAIPVHALSQLPAYVGSRFGLFREEGLDVQIVQIRTAVVAPALISRELDYSTALLLRVAATGLPIKAIAFGGISPALSLNVRPEIRTVAGLKGKNIPVSSRGSTTCVVARGM